MKTYNLKLLGILILGFSFSATVKAQDTKAVELGIKAGANYSSLNLDNVKDETGLLGYHIGAFAKLNITSLVGIQGEALFTTKGTEVTYDSDLLSGKTSLKLDYVEIPVLLVLRLSNNVNIHGGPYFAYLVDASAKNDANISIFDFEKEVNKDNFKGQDMGLVGGIGLDFSNIHAGVRYSHGLDRIQKDKTYDGFVYSFDHATNSQFQVYLGIGF